MKPTTNGVDPDEVISSTGVGQLDYTPLPVVRTKRGTFAPGHSGNVNGRPTQSLAELCRLVTNKRRLVQILGEIGGGCGPYKKAELAVRVRAIQIILSYGYGVPASVDTNDDRARAEMTLTVKRVVGVRDADV
jgi:hypothetical protein